MNLLIQLRAMPRVALAFVLARAFNSFGAAITVFVLDVWIYKQTGSYGIFAVVAVLTALPGLLLAPIAGLIVDRYPRKPILILCDVGSGLAVLSLAIASGFGALSTVHVGAVAVLLATLRTIAWPATWAILTGLTAEAHRARVNGIAETLEGATTVLSPMLGAFLFGIADLSIVFSIDIVLGLVCILVVTRITVPDAIASAPVSERRHGSVVRALLHDCLFGFRWILARKDLTRLLLFFMVTNLGNSVYVVAYTPYILSFATPSVLGICMGLGGTGIIAGGVIFAATGGLKRHEVGVLLGVVISGVSMIFAGMLRSSDVLYAAAFVYGLSIPLINASSQTIWQSQTPSEVMGRVFSTRRMIAWGLNPLSILISIPLSVIVFGPMLKMGGSGWRLEQVWGLGQPGTLGLMISVCGLMCLSVAVVLLLNDGLRIRDTPPDSIRQPLPS